MSEIYVGFDSAWGDRVPGAIAGAIIDGETVEFVEPHSVNFDQAIREVERLTTNTTDYLLVAIDQPVVVANQTGSRPVESVVRSVICSLRSAVQPANLAKADLFGNSSPFAGFKGRLGASVDPMAARAASAGRYLVEAYPALALSSWVPEVWVRRSLVRYNPSNRRKFLLDDWQLVCRSVARIAECLEIAGLSDWVKRLSTNAEPNKEDQDRLDACICLIVALSWRKRLKGQLMALIGDVDSGYIVSPVCENALSKLRPSAKERSVICETVAA